MRPQAFHFFTNKLREETNSRPPIYKGIDLYNSLSSSVLEEVTSTEPYALLAGAHTLVEEGTKLANESSVDQSIFKELLGKFVSGSLRQLLLEEAWMVGLLDEGRQHFLSSVLSEATDFAVFIISHELERVKQYDLFSNKRYAVNSL